VGKALGVRWVVMGKVSKTSNLIWLFSGELIDVETGQLLLDDDCELKGDPDTMVPAGVGLFANRIDKRITAGS
jgi:TolB-like protein